MQQKLEIHVISNTHWDREWLYSFQETRLMLVNFMNRLLEIFKTEPDYKSYLLDSQVVPIEDYLEIHPERRQEIENYVKNDRLYIGPWYTLPEEHIVAGESLVRNLLIGHRVSAVYGKTMKIGYSPFSYGQAAQMPQIYNGFGIDTILFYHGIRPDESGAEFIFEGPDGSQLFGSRMGSFARYNFFFLVFRPSVYKKSTLEREYNWQEGGLPFHLCGEADKMEHHFLVDPVRQFDIKQLPQLLQKFKEIEAEHATTQYIAGMQGMDSTLPDPLEIDIVKAAQQILPADKIIHSSLPEWMAKVRAAAKDLTVLKGERRTPKEIGTRVHLYGDVTSTRTRMKRQNALAEVQLQRLAEPAVTQAWLLNKNYPTGALTVAWKTLLKCHPHDSIAGTGIDQIEKDVLNRLDQVQNISHGLLRQGLQTLQLHIDNSNVPKNQVLLTVWNPSPTPRSEILTAYVDLPHGSELNEYSLWETQNDTPVEYWEISRQQYHPVIRHLGDATMQMPSIRVKIQLKATELPAFGYRTYRFKPESKRRRLPGSLVKSYNVMENQYLRVKINANGTLDITEKSSGHTFYGLHYFEDSGEAGHAWRHVKPANDQLITSHSARISVIKIEDSPLQACFRIDYRLELPAELIENKVDMISRLDADGDNARRSDKLKSFRISSYFTLSQGSRQVAVKTIFDNVCQDHRLRVMFPTRLDADYSAAESAFEVVERPIRRDENSLWRETWNPTHPHHRFVDVSDSQMGLAVLNDGLREYEVTDDNDCAIGITLIRAFEVALTTVAWRWERHPQMELSQAPGRHEFRYAIYPHTGNWEQGRVYREAEKFTVPIQLAQAGPHPGNLPQELSFLRITPAEIVLSAIKKCCDRETLIIRAFNPAFESKTVTFRFYKPVKQAWLNNLNEERQESLPAEDRMVKVDAGAKKIVTLEIAF
ncbi:MAG: alpha-mannosidase [Methanosarcinaceae archaeon]